MRFLADMGVSLRVVEWLRSQGHDAMHLREHGLQKLPDSEIFDKAIAERRVLLTFDLDFAEITALCRGRRTGVILFRLHNTRASNVIRRIEMALQRGTEALAADAMVVVEESRVRVRQFPPPSTPSDQS